jgi:serine/threonine-protein kinase
VRELLRRCLIKDPRNRLQAIGDARIVIDEAIAQPAEKYEMSEAVKMSATQSLPARRALPWAVAGVMTLAALALGVMVFLRPAPAPSGVTRFTIHLADVAKDFSMTISDVVPLAISPDGKKIAFEARGDTGRQIFLRTLENQEVRPIAGTENGGAPFFSPDSQSIGFFANNKLKQVSVAGGVAVTLADAATQRGATWADDNSIIFSPAFDSGLWRVPATGGILQQLSKPDASKNERTHRWPFAIPGTDVVLFSIGAMDSPNNYDAALLAALSVKTGKITLLGEKGSSPIFVRSGHMLFGRGRALFAVPFDLRALKLTGPATPVQDQVGCEPASGAFFLSLSRDGTLVSLPSTASQGLEIVLMDRAGKATPLPLPARNYQYPRFSPRGDKLVFNFTGPSGAEDAWVFDLNNESLSRLTFEVDAYHPIWTPDAKAIVYSVLTGSTDGLYLKQADGSGKAQDLIVTKGAQPIPAAFFPDGKSFVYMHTGSIPDIAALRLDDPSKPEFLVKTPAQESSPALSPDGRWLAYTSTESGRGEVYVTQLPGAAGRWQVSPEGGDDPLWSHDMKEMFFKRGDEYFAVPIRISPTFQAGTPQLMFSGKFERPIVWIGNWDVSPDGKKFALVRPYGNAPRFGKILVTINWVEELRQRAPTK